MRPLSGRAFVGALLAVGAAVAVPGLVLTPAAADVTRVAAVRPARVALPQRLPHGLGAVPPATRRPASRYLQAARVGAASLPASVDLSAKAPAIGDQGQVGSCGPWAIGYSIMGYYAKTQPHAGAPFSAMSLYNAVNGGHDNGTTVFQLYDALQGKGITEQAVWTHGVNDYKSRAGTAEAANALKHRTTGGAVLFLGDGQGAPARTAIETALAAGHPVAIGMPVYNPFFKLSARDSVMTLAKATGANAGGHEVAAYGYDATGVKIANSWGTGWGNAGWATLSWDFVGAYVFEASTPGTFAASTVPAPAQTARTLAVAAGTKVAAATGGTVVVTSSGFGTTNADVAAGRLAVTVNRARAKATWISDGALAVAVPAGTPGAKASIAVSRSGTAWAPVSVPYVATITAMSVTSGPSSGGTVTTLTGRGFTGASTWALTRADGTLLVALPVVTSLDRAQAGVVVVNDTSAKVKLPPAPSGFLPVVVTFTPDQKVYPGAASAPTAAAVFTYSDLG